MKCPDCAVETGNIHISGCDIERCSICGDQWISCGHEEHDPNKSKWTGELPDMRHPMEIANDLARQRSKLKLSGPENIG